MMSYRSKKELLEAIRPRYLKATRKEKKHILDEFIAARVITVNTLFECSSIGPNQKA